MKPFQLPRWRQQQLRRVHRRQDQIVGQAVSAMEAVLHTAIAYILEHYEKTGRYVAPSLNAMDSVTDNFYLSIVNKSLECSREEKAEQAGKKRLAKSTIQFDDISQVMRNPKYFQRIMKRSKKMTDRMRKQYLKKISKQFHDIMPLIQSGEISIPDAKKELEDKWKASKSRVETIFRTETTNYFAKTQVQFFSDDPEIIGFLFDSIRDKARTDICRSRHGLIYRPGTKLLKENTPALHYNCRSNLIALANTPHNRKLLEDKSRDPVGHAVAPLPPGWRK